MTEKVTSIPVEAVSTKEDIHVSLGATALAKRHEHELVAYEPDSNGKSYDVVKVPLDEVRNIYYKNGKPQWDRS